MYSYTCIPRKSSSSCPFSCKRNRALHSLSRWVSQFLAQVQASIYYLNPNSLLSFSTVLLQVFLGLPLVNLSSGVQDKAIFVFLLALFLNTCPITLEHLCFIFYIRPRSYLFIWHFHWPVNLQNASQALVKEDIKLVLFAFDHLSCFATIKKNSQLTGFKNL